jgi:uncharacterized protein
MPAFSHSMPSTASGANTVDWAPYLAGAGIGVLTWIAFLVFSEPLGVTTELSRAASLFARPLIGADGVAGNPYWRSMPLAWDFSVAFMVGIPLGAFVSAWLQGLLKVETIPAYWRHRFGASIGRRLGAAFVGGAIMMFGARLAGGCTSGHGISGVLQLAASSWVFLIVLAVTTVVLHRAVFVERSAS